MAKLNHAVVTAEQGNDELNRGVYAINLYIYNSLHTPSVRANLKDYVDLKMKRVVYGISSTAKLRLNENDVKYVKECNSDKLSLLVSLQFNTDGIDAPRVKWEKIRNRTRKHLLRK